MGLFDNIEDEESKGTFDDMPPDLQKKLKKLDMKGIKSKQDMLERLKDVFGEDAVSIKGDAVIVKKRHEEDSDSEAIHQALALNDIKWEKVVRYIAESIEVKPLCLDADGKEIKLNDFLVAEGKRKRVLRVGYKYVVLSRFDDVNEPDGVWFEDVVKEVKAVIEK